MGIDVSYLRKPTGENFYPVAHADASYTRHGELVGDVLERLKDMTASNVIFDDDIICAGNYTEVGNIKKALTETVVLETKGKSVKDVMDMIFTKEEQPDVVMPSVAITLKNSGYYEVGKTFTPEYNATFNSGAYSYDLTTGVELEAWDITDTNSNTSTDSSGSFDSFVVEDDTKYYVTATATHSDGNIAKTNLKNDSDPIVQILAGDITKDSANVQGYRSYFYGVLETTSSPTSDAIRALHNGGRYSASTTFTIKVNGNTNAKKIIIAIPSKLKIGVKKVLLESALSSDITSLYVKNETVQVDDFRGNGNNPASYDIWTYQPSAIDPFEIHKITIG